MSHKKKIRRNSICECGCGRKFKICNEEKRKKIEEEKRVLTDEQRKAGEKAFLKIQLMSAMFGPF